MKTLMIAFVFAALAGAQTTTYGLSNVGRTDLSRGALVLPAATFASPPVSPATRDAYKFTDASALGTCTGGGSAIALCEWTGSAWTAISGGGGGGSGSALTSWGASSTIDCTLASNVGACEVNPSTIPTITANNNFTGDNQLTLAKTRRSCVNNATTATVQYRLVSFASNGTCTVTPDGATNDVLGVAISGAGTTGSVLICTSGLCDIETSNATTAGDYLFIATTLGKATATATRPTSGTILGRIDTTNGAAGVRTISLQPVPVSSAGGVSSSSKTVRKVTGTTDTILTGDCGNEVDYTSTSSGTITLPQAGSAGFVAPCTVDMFNAKANPAGESVIVSPTISTIRGPLGLAETAYTIAAGQHLICSANGDGNWSCLTTLPGDIVDNGTNVIYTSRGIYLTNGTVTANAFKSTTTTVGSLGTCDAGAQGTSRYVTDASVLTFGITVTGGGSVKTPVACDGTNWVVH